MAAFTACSDDEGNTGGDPSAFNPVNGLDAATNTLGGDVTSDLVLAAGTTYTLNGALQVKAPATLTIGEGVTIRANNDVDEQVDYILIEQGAKINAQGTAENPIVMTAAVPVMGGWGGLHICGRAPINTQSGTGLSEIGNASYGGNDAADNSGVLRYIRLEYTGFAFDEEHESNGISFYGVGNGTQVSYVQACNGSDDGLEFFGGTVNIDHCVVKDCTDDSYDWTEGWRGTGSYLVAFQTDASCDCLIEADNNGNAFDADPVSHPTLEYLTLVGNNGSNERGVRLRAGTQVTMRHATITGKAKALTVETAETDAALKNGTSVLEDIRISGTLVNELVDANDNPIGTYLSTDFLAASGNAENQTFDLNSMDKIIANGNSWIPSWMK